MHRVSSVVSLAVLLGVVSTPSWARPAYAEKEKKPCGFCHVDPAGGGPRNDRGKYYGSHNHSLVGLPPGFTSLWKLTVSADARRVASADLTGDKKPRLLLLGAGGALDISTVAGEQVTKEASIDVGPKSMKLTVGQFAKGKPAVIALPGAVWFRSGDKYVKKASDDLTEITGSVKFAGGDECIFSFDGFSQPMVWAVDTTGPKAVVDAGQNMVMPDQGAGVYASAKAYLATDAAAALGLPEPVQKGGVFGMWDPRADGTLYMWAPWVAADGDYVVFADIAAVASAADIKPVWRSAKFEGKILDVSIGVDPREGKRTGLLVLMSTGTEGKERKVEFLALD